MSLDGRHRDENGRISQKRGDTRVDSLRQTYPGFAPGVRGDARLDSLRNRTGESLTQMVRGKGPKK